MILHDKSDVQPHNHYQATRSTTASTNMTQSWTAQGGSHISTLHRVLWTQGHIWWTEGSWTHVWRSDVKCSKKETDKDYPSCCRQKMQSPAWWFLHDTSCVLHVELATPGFLGGCCPWFHSKAVDSELHDASCNFWWVMLSSNGSCSPATSYPREPVPTVKQMWLFLLHKVDVNKKKKCSIEKKIFFKSRFCKKL